MICINTLGKNEENINSNPILGSLSLCQMKIIQAAAFSAIPDTAIPPPGFTFDILVQFHYIASSVVTILYVTLL